MVIRHSLKILEQLSEIESFISKIELFMEEKGIELDREKLLRGLFKEREMQKHNFDNNWHIKKKGQA